MFEWKGCSSDNVNWLMLCRHLQEYFACQPATVQWQNSENFAFIALITSNDQWSHQMIMSVKAMATCARFAVNLQSAFCDHWFSSSCNCIYIKSIAVFLSIVWKYLSHEHDCISVLLSTFPVSLKQILVNVIWSANDCKNCPRETWKLVTLLKQT